MSVRFFLFATAVAAAVTSAAACSGGSDGAGAMSGPDGSTSLDGAAGTDGASPRDASTEKQPPPACLPFVQSGTPLSVSADYRRFGPSSPSRIGLDPIGDLAVSEQSVTNYGVSRKAGGFNLHVPSSTLSVAQIFVDAAGNAYVAGTYRFVLGVSGAAPDGGELSFPVDGKPIFLAKFDAAGGLVYFRQYQATTDGLALPALTGAALGADGHVWLAGSTTKSVDFGLGELPAQTGGAAFLVELDESGVALRQRQFGSAGITTGAMAVGADGGPVVAIHLENPVGASGVGLGVAAFAADAADRFLEGYQSAAASKGAPPSSIAVSSTGDIAIAGRYLGVADFGGGALPSAPEARPYVARLSSAGTTIGARALPLEVDPRVGAPAVGFAADGRLVFGGTLRGAFDFGLGLVAPAATADAKEAPLVLTFDPAMTLTGASTFNLACAKGSCPSVRAIFPDSAAGLRVAVADCVTTWTTTVTP
jgi:hypothetical protein